MTRWKERAQLLNTLGIQFDLALEAHDLLRGARGGEVPGVMLEEEELSNATVKTVTILNEQGAQNMGKPIGTYITISSDALKINNHAEHAKLSDVLTSNLQKLLPLSSPDDLVLVVGLGNWKATPDSLGPRVTGETMATRHLFGRIPPDILAGVRPVSTIAPGVLGITGIETAEIIQAVVERIQPKLVIAFDALAAGDVSRIGTTIQLANTGIDPGSGLGNHRVGLNQETLGVPVIAVGIPTVVNAAVIAHNVLESFLEQLENKPHLQKLLDDLPQPLLENVIRQTLSPYNDHLAVTPKEIDDIIANAVEVIAQSLKKALHPQMNEDFANCFV